MQKLFKIPVILLAIMLAISCEKEQKASNKINIEKPDGWFDMNVGDVYIENLKRAELNDELIEKMEASEDGVVLYFYTKYDLSNYDGISPTINLTLRKNVSYYNLEDLLYQGSLMPEVSKEMGLEEYSLLKNEYTYLPNGTKAVEQNSTFKLPNRAEKISSSVYFYFISDKWYVQLSLSCVDDEKCDEVYNKVLKNL
tara:strand:- start:1789 stop:2379 length:591 start_codon:yes stop_codon:yes gene_type:complete